MFGNDVTVVPAYGRDYKSAKSALADWHAGKDFQCATTGRYLSVRDAANLTVWIRYNKLQRVTPAK